MYNKMLAVTSFYMILLFLMYLPALSENRPHPILSIHTILASAALRLGPPGLLTKTTKVHILKLDTSTKIDTAIP